MTEFLTENVRRAYPLKYRIPVPADADAETAKTYDLLGQILVDAAIYCNARIPDSDTTDSIRLIRMYRAQGAETMSLRIGTGTAAADGFSVTLRITDTRRFSVFYAASGKFKAFLTVNNAALEQLFATPAYGTWDNLDIPFAARCVDVAVPVVESIAVYTPKDADMCRHVVFSGSETPVKTITGGDVTVSAGDGLDLETLHMEPVKGDILRISAITAAAESSDSSRSTAIMLRGDGCIEVENIPGADVDDNNLIVKLDNPANGGVIRLRQLCKPCCQCSDYSDAFNRLKPANDAASTMRTTLRTIHESYDAAVTAFNTLKQEAVNAVNDYDHVYVNATSVTSRPIYGACDAEGSRNRISVNVLIVNMTKVMLTVADCTIAMNNGGYAKQSVHWSSTGAVASSGQSDPHNVSLSAGGTMAIAFTYAKTSKSNTGEKPVVTPKANVTMTLATKPSTTKTVSVV